MAKFRIALAVEVESEDSKGEIFNSMIKSGGSVFDVLKITKWEHLEVEQLEYEDLGELDKLL